MENRFSGRPVIGILRGLPPDCLRPVLDAVTQGGLRYIEITMNSPGALEQIAEAVRIAGAKLVVGAGTVTNRELLQRALSAGAQFIVTPTVHRELICDCVKSGVPVFPGAFSPTEICLAWELGATMVKVFPAETGGPAYIRALRGPFPKIKLLPTGGVDLGSAEAYLRAGAAGLGVGSPLFNPSRIDAGDWTWLADQTASYLQVAKSFCAT